jgi:hypothetical protein
MCMCVFVQNEGSSHGMMYERHKWDLNIFSPNTNKALSFEFNAKRAAEKKGEKCDEEHRYKSSIVLEWGKINI